MISPADSQSNITGRIVHFIGLRQNFGGKKLNKNGSLWAFKFFLFYYRHTANLATMTGLKVSEVNSVLMA